MGNDGCCTGTRTTSHSGGDKDHLGSGFENLPDLPQIFYSSLFPFFGGIPGSTPLCEGHTKLYLHRHRTVGKCLCIGVADDKIHAGNPVTVHVVDRIAAASTHSNYLDDRVVLVLETE